MPRVREGHVLATILALSVAGMGIAAYLVVDHFFGVEVCDPNPWIGCGEVNRGPYSKIVGIPWSVIGLAGFAAVFVLALVRRFYRDRDEKEMIMPAILGLSYVGVVTVVYLNYLEVAVIHKICPYCAASHIIMLLITLIAQWWLFLGQSKRSTASRAETDSNSKTE